MNNETINKARQTRLRNKLRNEIAGSKWRLAGTEFCRFEWLGLYEQHTFALWFYCNLKRVRVFIYGIDEYGLPDVDNTFEGENAWDECIEWTADKIIEMTNTALERQQRSHEDVRANYHRKVYRGE